MMFYVVDGSTVNESFWQMARILRRDKRLCDIKLHVQDCDGNSVAVHAHKLVLVCASRYFLGLLDSKELDRMSNLYCLDVKYNTMILLLDLLYGQEVDFDILPTENVDNLLMLARKFQVGSVETRILCYKARQNMFRQSSSFTESSNPVFSAGKQAESDCAYIPLNRQALVRKSHVDGISETISRESDINSE